ncbi:purine and uridine phosphorylase [Aspergillus tetrazonus]
MASLGLDDYTIAWVCALPLEAAAARAMLDRIHTPPQQIPDPNAYDFGELNGHHIVLGYLPYGTVSAATVVSRMRLTFPRLRFGLIVGDVVVSKPGGKHGGVIQYDYGKAVQGGQFEPTGDAISNIVGAVLNRNPSMKEKFSPLDQHMDYLFRSSYYHADKNSDCEVCDKNQLVERQPRDMRAPCIHYGPIASGDRVMKDSETRDRLAQQHGILCFEMEAAGLMNELPTLKKWQGYAALTAAAYTKLLLLAMPVLQTTPGSLKGNRERHWIISLPRNPKFVGRQEEITNLEELLTMQDGPRRIAITGLGEVGKTQIALEVAYRIRDRDHDCTVLWVPCTSRALIEQMFLRFAEILGLHGVKPADVKEQMKAYLGSKRAGKWLLVFDNADDTEMWLAANDRGPALEDFLPQGEQGHILFTTRNRKLAMKLAPLTLQILRKALEHENLPEDDTTAAALLQQLAFLPLATTQAAAYIIENNISLSDYLALLQEQEEDAVELLSEDFRDPGRYKDIHNAVLTTWLISFNQIQHQNKAAADYLSFMVCINPRNTLDALGLLNAYSFTNSQDTDISMHRLVHIATRNWLKKNGLFSYWIQKVADRIQEVFPDDNYTNRTLWRKYLPHVQALMQEDEFIKQQKQHTNLIQNTADCLASDGRYFEAKSLYKELETVLGAEHLDTLTSMANLASTWKSQSRLTDALTLIDECCKLRNKVLGSDHPDTRNSANVFDAWNDTALPQRSSPQYSF